VADPLLCVVCAQVEPNSPPVCDRDRQRLARALWELRDLHALLPHALEPGRGTRQMVRVQHIEASMPLAVDPLDLAARTATYGFRDSVQDYVGDQVGAVGVAAILDGWARDWSAIRDDEELPDPTVDALVAWLSRRLPWALDVHPAIEEFAAELTVTLYVCRSTLSVSRRPLYSDEACPRCGTAALRRQSGDASWRCAECHDETPVEREDNAVFEGTYYGEAVLVVDEVETTVWAELSREQDADTGRKSWGGTIDNRLRTVTRDLGGSRGVLRLPGGEGRVFVARQATLRVNCPVEWRVQGDGPAPFDEGPSRPV